MDGRECTFLFEEHKKDGNYCQGDFIATRGVLSGMTGADFLGHDSILPVLAEAGINGKSQFKTIMKYLEEKKE